MAALPTIDQAFIDEFNQDVHIAYQQMESKLRGLVRTDADVRAQKTRFQTLSTVTSGPKARNGEIPPSNPEHAYVDCNMEDTYLLQFVDQLDLTKLNTDVRGNYVKLFAAAFGRFIDDQIFEAMEAGVAVAHQIDLSGSGNITRNGLLTATRLLDIAEVPRDGRWFLAVTPITWSFLMTITEFVNADYQGPNLPYLSGRNMKTWYGLHVFVSSLLPGAGTADAKNYLWHYDAIGHGINAQADIQWAWENTRRAWSASGAMSCGSCVIDTNGLIEINVDDTAALPS